MELNLINVDRNEARKAVADYRRALVNDRSKRAADEDAAILRGYREIARGHPVISLADTIRAGGDDRRFLPKLAISRADEPRITVRRFRDGSLMFGRNFQSRWRDQSGVTARGIVRLPAGTLPQRTAIADGWRPVEAHAIVPIIPPELRPNAALERYWILFEAEWQTVAPRDPALLRSLGGGLYAVVATWELSELERAVLGITRATHA